MLLRKLSTFEMASQSRDNPATARGPRGNSTHGKSRTIPGRLTYRSWTWVKHFPFVCKELLHKSKVSPWFVVKVREMPLVFSSLICSRGLLAGNRFLIWRGCDKFGYCAHHLHSARSDLWGQSNCIHVYIYIYTRYTSTVSISDNSSMRHQSLQGPHTLPMMKQLRSICR